MTRNQDHLLERIAQLLDALALQQDALGQTTAELARWRGQDVNGVLFAGVMTIAGTATNAAGVGLSSIDLGVAYGGLAVWNNLGAGVITVTNGPATSGDVPAAPGGPPGGGHQNGRLIVPGGAFWSGPFTGRALTVHGLAGASVNVVLTVNPLVAGA